MPRRPRIAAALVAILLVGCANGSLPSGAVESGTPDASASAGAATAPPPASGPVVSPTATGASGPLTLALEPVASGLEAPLDIALHPALPGDVFVAEQVGRIRVIRDGVLDPTPYLDISDRVLVGGEQGLLGIAFHPDPEDGRLFVYYTAKDAQQNVASFTAGLDADAADPASEVTLLRMEDRFGNHNGGGMVFGPDGNLYIATGDGGGSGDPLGSGRSLQTLLGKVLRIDVDATGPNGEAYGIPDDNPFAGSSERQPEIWLTGLRNPFRLRFDRATGDLWIGDVGQGSWEEIDVARAGVGGLDFGWNTMEGFDCFGTNPCDDDTLTLPIAAYGHDEGCSVIGGTVYRGTAQPGLVGLYVFSDYCSGRFWVLDPTLDERQEATAVLDSGRSISAIAEDGDGELLVTDLGGEVLRIVVAGS